MDGVATALYNAHLDFVICHVERTFKAHEYQMCVKGAKTQSEITKHLKKDHVFFVHSKL